MLLINNSVALWNSPYSKIKYGSKIIQGTNQQRISLTGVNIGKKNSQKRIFCYLTKKEIIKVSIKIRSEDYY